MKRRLLSLLLVFLLTFALLPLSALAEESCPTEEEVTEAILALKIQYPEGTPWSNESNTYSMSFPGITYIGYGCVAFAYLLSDAAFGIGVLPPTEITDVKFEDVRSGDILRLNNDTHSVIVVKALDDSVEIAEGNYNYSVHWGRILTKAEVEAASYLYTRYPDAADIRETCTDGHDWGCWYFDTAATCTEPGRYVRHCLNCSEAEYTSTAALGHQYENGVCVRCGIPEPDSPFSSAEGLPLPTAAAYQSGQFSDVKSDQWFASSVASAVEFGLMKGNGNGTFNPGGNVTIAEAVAMASRIHRIYNTGSGAFVQGTPWYQCYLDYAVLNRVAPYSYYTCDPNRPATRAEFAEIFVGSLPSSALPQANTVADNAIPDVKTTDVRASSVYTLYRAGILTGSNAEGVFCPHCYITRAECAAIVSRMADPCNRVSLTLN